MTLFFQQFSSFSSFSLFELEFDKWEKEEDGKIFEMRDIKVIFSNGLKQHDDFSLLFPWFSSSSSSFFVDEELINKLLLKIDDERGNEERLKKEFSILMIFISAFKIAKIQKEIPDDLLMIISSKLVNDDEFSVFSISSSFWSPSYVFEDKDDEMEICDNKNEIQIEGIQDNKNWYFDFKICCCE